MLGDLLSVLRRPGNVRRTPPPQQARAEHLEPGRFRHHTAFMLQPTLVVEHGNVQPRVRDGEMIDALGEVVRVFVGNSKTGIGPDQAVLALLTEKNIQFEIHWPTE